jgi:hypothetical protein
VKNIIKGTGRKIMSKLKVEFDLEIPPLEGFVPQQTAKAFWEIIKEYDLEPLEEIGGVNIAQHKKEVEERLKEKGMASMRRGGSQYVRGEKIEKMNFGWIVIRDAMLISTCMGWPKDDYDFPVLATTWDESEKHVHIIADFIPLVDLVMNESYLEKYLDPFEPTYKQYCDLLDAPPEHLSWFRALSSPYVIAGRPKADPDRARMKKALDCLAKYVKYWFEEIVTKAQPVTDAKYREQVKAKKEKIRDIYRRKDPGGAVSTAILGKELAWKGLKLTF